MVKKKKKEGKVTVASWTVKLMIGVKPNMHLVGLEKPQNTKPR